MADVRQGDSEQEALHAAVGKSRKLAARVPRLILEARRVASTVIHGLHGRRRAGAGENFWQYRRFVNGEPSHNVDWRRSARDGKRKRKAAPEKAAVRKHSPAALETKTPSVFRAEDRGRVG